MNRLRSMVSTSECFLWRCFSSTVARCMRAECRVAESLPWTAVLRVSHMRKKSFQIVVMIAVVQIRPVLELAVLWMRRRYAS